MNGFAVSEFDFIPLYFNLYTLQSPQNGEEETERVKKLSVVDRSSSGPFIDLALVEEDIFTNGTIPDSSSNCNHDTTTPSVPTVARKTRKYSEVTKVSSNCDEAPQQCVNVITHEWPTIILSPLAVV